MAIMLLLPAIHMVQKHITNIYYLLKIRKGLLRRPFLFKVCPVSYLIFP